MSTETEDRNLTMYDYFAFALMFISGVISGYFLNVAMSV